ncbi:uncharacterized protein L201_005840 [Kwoniella dendrophila CBS 6074]|uniref:Transcription factor spt8 beta-propeller domain-containing protein n=1 Tax=Kwoniella dendrophila CBS 6074 TaxID=1295534 RepID=A0AAX4JZX3_9TREE
MPGYDEDEEDEYYNDVEEEDDEGMNGTNADEDEGDHDDGMDDGSDEEGSEADEDPDENEDEDDEEEEDVDVDGEADNDDEDEDGDEGDNDEDEDEDQDQDQDQDQEASTEDEGEREEGVAGEDADADITMDGGEDDNRSKKSKTKSPSLKPISPQNLPPPPYKIRRDLFYPSYINGITPKSLSIEAIVGIPLPSPVHSLTSTTCLSYLLAGSQDGYVRVYDLWSSVNGNQMMTAQQRSVVGLGETINKAGVGRGWFENQVITETQNSNHNNHNNQNGNVNGTIVIGIDGGSNTPTPATTTPTTTTTKKAEPVYSMACEGDGLFTLTGTQSGPINLYTLRHSPGHLIHSLKGHTNVVSCMTLLPNEKGLLSGSWDGTVKEWDLNTGQTVRSYPTHGAQLSSISLRPYIQPTTPTPSPRRQPELDEEGEEIDGDITTKENISISMGPDFFTKKEEKEKEDEQAAEDALPIDGETESTSVKPEEVVGEIVKSEVEEVVKVNEDMDVEMSEAKSPSMDSLFGGDDDDEADGEGETAPPSIVPSKAPTPIPHRDISPPPLAPPKPKGLGLALPGQPKPSPAPATVQPPPPPPLIISEQPTPASSSTTTAPLFNIPQSAGAGPSSSRGAAAHIPLLTPTSYKAFSDDVILTSSMDGQVVLIDRRIPSNEGTGFGVGRLMPGERAPPWCMSACWSSNGTQVLAGRRNGTIDVWDVRRGSSSNAPNLLRTLRTPAESGPISCLVAFPDGNNIATASQDNIRLWNTSEYFDVVEESMKKKSSKPPFKIIAGHHGGTISSMIVDPTGKFLITASGDRGWQGESTKVVLIHEVKW